MRLLSILLFVSFSGKSQFIYVQLNITHLRPVSQAVSLAAQCDGSASNTDCIPISESTSSLSSLLESNPTTLISTTTLVSANTLVSTTTLVSNKTLVTPAIPTRTESHAKVPWYKAPNTPEGIRYKNFRKLIRLAHGVVMAVVFVGLYPFAALMLRVFKLRHGWIIHAVLQILAMLGMYVGLGLGAWFANESNDLFLSLHTKLGLAIGLLMLLQPIFGWMHHRGYVRTGGRTGWSTLHCHWGRILILIGGVNGIIVPPRSLPRVLFASLFGIVIGVYVVIWIVTAISRRRSSLFPPEKQPRPHRRQILDPEMKRTRL
jgi:hypothetical protein